MAGRVRAIKARIGNIEDIAQITKAMHTIAMTKVMRMKRRLERSRPFIASLEGFIADLLGQSGPEMERHPLSVDNGANDLGVLVLNADRGLCGRYKADLNRRAEGLLAGAGGGKLLAGGEKARLFFSRRGIEPLKVYAHAYDTPSWEAAASIVDDAIELYRSGEFGRLLLVYMRFVSDLSQRLVVEDLLPIGIEPHATDMLIEPDLPAVLDAAIPFYLRAKLYAAILETKASEDAIRRQAMKNATDNAEDLVKALTRAYNKARQQAITREIADILGGAEALRKG